MPDHIKYLLTFASTPVFGTCDDETIEQFEASLNVRLPEEYKEFLKVRNGTRFKSLLRFPVSEDYPADSGLWENLAVLFGLGDEHNHRSIVNQRSAYELSERVPDWIVPIGESGYRVFICLSCGDSDYGRIYAWKPESDWEDVNEQTYKYLYLAADSFSEFCLSLTVDEDDDEDVVDD